MKKTAVNPATLSEHDMQIFRGIFARSFHIAPMYREHSRHTINYLANRGADDASALCSALSVAGIWFFKDFRDEYKLVDIGLIPDDHEQKVIELLLDNSISDFEQFCINLSEDTTLRSAAEIPEDADIDWDLVAIRAAQAHGLDISKYVDVWAEQPKAEDPVAQLVKQMTEKFNFKKLKHTDRDTFIRLRANSTNYWRNTSSVVRQAAGIVWDNHIATINRQQRTVDLLRKWVTLTEWVDFLEFSGYMPSLETLKRQHDWLTGFTSDDYNRAVNSAYSQWVEKLDEPELDIIAVANKIIDLMTDSNIKSRDYFHYEVFTFHATTLKKIYGPQLTDDRLREAIDAAWEERKSFELTRHSDHLVDALSYAQSPFINKELSMNRTPAPAAPAAAHEVKEFIYGREASTVSDEQLINHIRNLEGQIRSLKDIGAKSENIANKIKGLESDLNAIVEVLDARK